MTEKSILAECPKWKRASVFEWRKRVWRKDCTLKAVETLCTAQVFLGGSNVSLQEGECAWD